MNAASRCVGVLVTNYQAWPTTRETVRAILSHAGHGVTRVLVVDDGSDAPAVWPEDGNVVIHRNPENLGYVASVNVGMSLMEEELVVLLDCDARPLNDFVPEVLARFNENPRLGALGFTQTDDRELLRPAGESCPSLLDFIIGPSFAHRFPFSLSARKPTGTSILCLHSCCIAIRRAAFENVSGFDESFDFLDADNDFSIRLNRSGWRTALTSEVLCFHPGSGSPQSTTTRVLRFHRNRWRLLRKHGFVRCPAVVRPFLFLRHLLEWLALMLLRLRTPSPELRDKASCRVTLLKSVWKDYSPG